MNMKFYESHYEEYIQSSNNYNIHPELEPILKNLPDKISDLGNLIVYGPSGVGKYTQTLHMIKKYSPSNLKYDKKIKVDTDKNSYVYRISDIHYEIDMALLGCNSKIIWHEVFLQIVDIISVKNEKKGIILCKNFHMIHTELLEIFYSYIQQYNHPHSMIQIRFIISTEHISFLPNNILQCCKIIHIMRPSGEEYINISQGSSEAINPTTNFSQHSLCKTSPVVGVRRTQPGTTTSILYPCGGAEAKLPLHKECSEKLVVGGYEERKPPDNDDSRSSDKLLPEKFGNISQVASLPEKERNNLTFIQRISKLKIDGENKIKIDNILSELNSENIINIKELKSFSLFENEDDIPDDIFNIICNNIIQELTYPNKIVFTNFRDTIYDILIYNLDFTECLWYILNHFIKNGSLSSNKITNILKKTHLFLKYYNNNYRPIYHLESIFFYIIIQIHNYGVFH